MSEPQTLQQVDRTYVRVNGRKLSYFAGCDYFRLASHPEVLKATHDGLDMFGLNVAASRLTTGNHELFEQLERALASFFDVPSATLVSNGYVSNLIAAQALAGTASHAIIDEKAHPSLKDAAVLLGCSALHFKHRDPQDVRRVVAKCGRGAKIILLTDGMFSHDGGLSPLKEYLNVLPRGATMLVDDAHGAGTLGKTGKGTVELQEIPRTRVIQTITLSKAFGVYGGAILATEELRNKIFTASRMFVGNTPLPLPLAHAAIRSVKILKANPQLRRRLNENVAFVKAGLGGNGHAVSTGLSPIIPITPRTPREAKSIQTRCLQNKVFPSFIKYPGGPENGYFRFVICSEHTRIQLKSLLSALG